MDQVQVDLTNRHIHRTMQGSRVWQDEPSRPTHTKIPDHTSNFAQEQQNLLQWQIHHSGADMRHSHHLFTSSMCLCACAATLDQEARYHPTPILDVVCPVLMARQYFSSVSKSCMGSPDVVIHLSKNRCNEEEPRTASRDSWQSLSKFRQMILSSNVPRRQKAHRSPHPLPA